jgi:predicted DNA-binding transcriptional regulator AlpA
MSRPHTNGESKTKEAAARVDQSMRRLLLTNEAADLLRISEKTMIRMRQRGEGPQFIRLNRRIVYDVLDLEAFISKRKHRSTSEYGI